MAEKKTFIYTLSDPRTGDVRYVGRTTNPEHRLSMHVIDGHVSDRKRWLIDLISSGQVPIMTLIDEVQHDPKQAEQYWINRYEEQDARLLNINNAKGLANRRKRKPHGRRGVPHTADGIRRIKQTKKERFEPVMLARLEKLHELGMQNGGYLNSTDIGPCLGITRSMGLRYMDKLVELFGWMDTDSTIVGMGRPRRAIAYNLLAGFLAMRKRQR